MRITKVNLGGQDQKVLEKCRELETSFWHIMVKEMTKTVTNSQKNSLATDFFKDMFRWEVANILAQNSKSGLAEAVYKQFKLDSSKPMEQFGGKLCS